MDNKSTSGSFPRDFTIGSFSFGPTPQTLLGQGADLHIEFRWTDILRGHLCFPLIQIKELTFTPSRTQTSSYPDVPALMEEAKKSFTASLSHLPPLPLVISQIQVASLKIPDDLRPMEWKIQGALSLPWSQKEPAKLEFSAQETSLKTHFQGALILSKHAKFLKSFVLLEDSDSGLLSTWSGLQGATSFSTDLHYDIKADHLTVSTQVTNTLYGSLTGSCDTHLLPSKNISSVLEIHLTLEPGVFGPHFPSQWHLTSTALLSDHDLTLTECQVFSDILSFEASAHYTPKTDALLGTLKGNMFLDSKDTSESISLVRKLFPSMFLAAESSSGLITMPILLSIKTKGPQIYFSSQVGNATGSLVLQGNYNVLTHKLVSQLRGPENSGQPSISGEVTMDVDTKHLRVEALKIYTPFIKLTGNWEGDVSPWSLETSSGEVIFSLSHMGNLFESEFSGSLSGTLVLKKNQGLTGSLLGEKLNYSGYSVETLKGSVTFPWSKTLPLDSSLVLEDLHDANSLFVDKLSLQAHGHLYNPQDPVKFTMKGVEKSTTRLRIQGWFVNQSHTWRGGVHDFLLTLPPLHLVQKEKATFTFENNTLSLQDVFIQAGKGSLDFALHYSPQKLTGHLFLKDFSLDEITHFLPSLPSLPLGVSGKIHLEGTPVVPKLTYELDLKSVVKTIDSFFPKNTVTGHVSGRYNGQDVMGSVSAHVSEAPSQNFSLQARIPLLYMPPFSFSMPEHTQLSLKLDSEGSLESFCPFFLPPSFVLTGPFKAHFSLDGSIKKPVLTGLLSIENGSFSSYDAGTVLENLTLRVRAQENYFYIDKLSATDGKEGCLEGRGNLSQFFLHPSHTSYGVTLTFKNFLGASIDLVTASITGEIQCVPDLLTKMPVVSGHITLEPLSVHIPKKLPDSLTTLPVTYTTPLPNASHRKEEAFFLKTLDEQNKNRFQVIEIVPPVPANSTSPDTSSMLDSVSLNITAQIPPKFSIDGWGLQSLWEGSVLIGGKVSDPELKGSITLVKGTFTILSRTLTLDQGLLKFLGKKGFDPDINVRASLATSDIIAHVIMKGTIMNPQFGLSSEPSLSESEIISRILFGKSVGSLSPFQSLQIVTALAELTGTSSPVSLVHQLKDALGLGALNFTTGGPDTAGPGLSLGKDFTDEITIEIEQGLTPESTKASAQIKLLPQVTLQSDIDATSAIGAGINWRWDY